MKRLLAAGILVLLGALPALAQGEKVIDVRAAGPAAGNSFEALWSAYRKAEAAKDAEGARKILDEIRRLRIERNVRSLEVLGLALVSRGIEDLDKGERDKAEEDFRRAMTLDPNLPDAYFGSALADLKRGPFGIPAAIKDVVAGMAARFPTARGRYYLLALLVAVGLVAAFATTTVFAVSMVVRHGTLLLHDLEESFGQGKRPIALAVYVVLLLLPLLTFQGYAWLPLWALALALPYASRTEKIVIGGVLAACVTVGPVVKILETQALASQNPLLRASLLAIEGGGDGRAIADLEAAVRTDGDDRDLVYLLALQYKKAGRYDDAAALYKEILRNDEKDAIALNNLGNIEFARAEFPAAITRYKQAKQLGESSSTLVLATLNYNLSLAHLQKFEREDANEARSQADRLDSGVTRAYDALWKYDTKNEGAVVDLGLTPDQVLAKFAGVRAGDGQKNVAVRRAALRDSGDLLKAALNRFSAFLAVFAVVVILLERWRGKRMFTMRCQKCGTPFCKRCHLGASPAGLCTQCFHLFVVRDGVSGPARNQKLMEVQKEDERRERIFRALSLLSPGAGHFYAQKTLVGGLLALTWYLLLALVLLAGRLFPVTEAPAALVGKWGLAAIAVLLLATYVAANRARPDFEVSMPSPSRGARRRAAA